MKVHVEMEEKLLAAIDRAAEVQKISRDVAFKEALEAWLAHVSKLEGALDSDSIPFKIYRPGPEGMPEFYSPQARLRRAMGS